MEFNEDRNTALNFLQEHPLGVVSTQNSKGDADLAVVYFFTEKDFTTYFVTKTVTRKFRNIIDQGKATLLAYDEDSLTSVEVQGQVRHVHDTAEIAQALEHFSSVALSRKGGYWVPPVSQIEGLGNFAVCKLHPKSVLFTQYATDLNDGGMPRQLSFNS